MNNILISPSILSADFTNLESEFKKISNSSADMIHIDVMDGHFVPNLTIGPEVIKQLRKLTSKPFDVHLMIQNAEDTYEDYIKAGADFITFHVEVCKNPENLINKIKSKNIKVGISIKPNTEVELIKEFINQIDLALVMSVEPGFGGQKFLEISLDKIEKLKNYSSTLNPNLIISVDGGINDITAKQAISHGANMLVSGSHLFKADDFDKSVIDLRKNL